MLVGHFAVAFAAKRIGPRSSLGTLMLAAMLADVLWCVFMLVGLEQVEFRSGRGAANYSVAVDIAWSHSLVTGVLWGVVLAAATAGRARSSRMKPQPDRDRTGVDVEGDLDMRRGAWIVFAAVLSHWLLDFISHPPDMPIAPGLPGRFGLGLWTSVPATVIIEGGAWIAALIFYARVFRPRGRARALVLWTVVGLVTLVWYNNIAGPPPPNPQRAPIRSLVFFSLVIAWAYWIGAGDRGQGLNPANDDHD